MAECILLATNSRFRPVRHKSTRSRQRGHRTCFGDNGAVKITFKDGTVVVDLLGADGKSIADILLENQQ